MTTRITEIQFCNTNEFAWAAPYPTFKRLSSLTGNIAHRLFVTLNPPEWDRQYESGLPLRELLKRSAKIERGG
jgi:hypothetical protein